MVPFGNRKFIFISFFVDEFKLSRKIFPDNIEINNFLGLIFKFLLVIVHEVNLELNNRTIADFTHDLSQIFSEWVFVSDI